LKLQPKTNFEKFADGKLTKNGFLTEKERLEFEISVAENELAKLEEIEVLNGAGNGKTPLETIKRLAEAENLTRERMILLKKENIIEICGKERGF
jgi:hypothetical protein